MLIIGIYEIITSLINMKNENNSSRKENDKMEFIKGTIIGMVAGTCLGVIKNEMFCDVIKQGKRKFRKIQKKMNF